MENLDVINKHNALFTAGEVTYKMGLHEYSDENSEDVIKMRSGVIVPE
jgi:hypothetical protein